jgi:uncharacterized protein YfaT (DUF1175 family)
MSLSDGFLFRVRYPSGGMGEDGSYFSLDDFSSFADARILMEYNSVYVGRDVSGLLAGDLLFFEQDDLETEDVNELMHIMIALGRRDGEDVLVYHTGDPVSGAVRKLTLATLNRHPDARWHPHAANPRFRGVFRLALIADGGRR